MNTLTEFLNGFIKETINNMFAAETAGTQDSLWRI